MKKRPKEPQRNVWEALVTLGNWSIGVEKSNLRKEPSPAEAELESPLHTLRWAQMEPIFLLELIKRMARQQHWGVVIQKSWACYSNTFQQGIYVVRVNENETARAHKQGAVQLNQTWTVVADETIQETATVNHPVPCPSPRWRSKKEQILIKEWALDRGDDDPVW